MGTRADFYVGRGESAEWIGSIAWDGYPTDDKTELLAAQTEQEFRAAVSAYLASREDGTTPDMGWPWPWENSRLTDYAYAFDGGTVWACVFGHKWFDPEDREPDEDEDESSTDPYAEPCTDDRRVPFPDMSSRKRVARGERSGLLVFKVSP